MTVSTREMTMMAAGAQQPLSTLLSTLPTALNLGALETAYPSASNPGVFGQFGAAAPYALAWSTGAVWKTVTIV
jgi:hypothetical protein